MKSIFLFILSLVVLGRAAEGQAGATPPTPPTSDGVTVAGEVIADGTGMPIPYGTVKLLPLGRERFTDRRGLFVYYAVPAGDYRMQVRMVGYLPLDTAVHVSGRSALSLKLTMIRIPTALEAVQVMAPPRLCLFPDEMGYVEDPELGTVLLEARKNAERENLLRRTYPFEYRIAQSHETYDLKNRRSSMQYDTVTYRSDDSWRYRKGKVVSDDRNRIFGEVRLMRLPTLADLADRRFLAAHCFKYSGIVDDNGKPAHRIDFLPDSTLMAPDVEGSIYMDSATYLIRRAEFRLTRGGTIKPAILKMEVTTTYTEILPNVALFDLIKSVQPLVPSYPGGPPREFREIQRLLTYRFIYTGPPGTPSRKWIPMGGDSAAIAGKASPTAQKGPPEVKGTAPSANPLPKHVM